MISWFFLRSRFISNEVLWAINASDTILATHEAFLLGKWLLDSRSIAPSGQENLFEWNARRQITVWPPDNVSVFMTNVFELIFHRFCKIFQIYMSRTILVQIS